MLPSNPTLPGLLAEEQVVVVLPLVPRVVLVILQQVVEAETELPLVLPQLQELLVVVGLVDL